MPKTAISLVDSPVPFSCAIFNLSGLPAMMGMMKSSRHHMMTSEISCGAMSSTNS